jgi:hypothetical protein
MDDPVPFGSADYFLLLAILGFGRGMDFLSTWIATPNLVLEGNPIAKLLGWRLGLPVNIIFCLVFALWPLPAIIITTTSLLVAARNLQSAWLMRSLGEEPYRSWMVERIRETRPTLYLFCLFTQNLLVAAIGSVLIVFSEWALIPFGIGTGMVAYAIAVTLFSLLAIWRIRRAFRQG